MATAAALQEVAARHIGTLGDANQRPVPARRVHEPTALAHRRRRRLHAVVEDHVLVNWADREQGDDLGGAVVRWGVAGLGGGAMEVLKLVDIGDEQGGVVVEDVENPGRICTQPEVWYVVRAANLEPDHQAVGIRCVVGDDPEREGDVHAAA